MLSRFFRNQSPNLRCCSEALLPWLFYFRGSNVRAAVLSIMILCSGALASCNASSSYSPLITSKNIPPKELRNRSLPELRESPSKNEVISKLKKVTKVSKRYCLFENISSSLMIKKAAKSLNSRDVAKQ